MFVMSLQMAGCQSSQVEQSRYYHWMCQQGEYAEVVEIEYVRQGEAFYGFYTYGGEGTFIMGMIDKDGNLTGISAATAFGEIEGKLSGKISGDKLHAEWSPSPSALDDFGSVFQEMELTLLTDSPEITNEYLAEYGFIPETPYTSVAYGYRIGEWEERYIFVGESANQGKAEFYLQIAEGGMNDIDVTITGTVTLNGNTFRYREKNCEFEVAVYNGFITVKTISGRLEGFQVDGVYPTVVSD
jgi:hypothetical protein